MAKFTTYKVIQLPTSNIDENGLYFVKEGDKWRGYLRSGGLWVGQDGLEHTGDVTGKEVLTIEDGVVSNEKLSDVPPMTLKGSVSIDTDTPRDLTAKEVRELLNVKEDSRYFFLKREDSSSTGRTVPSGTICTYKGKYFRTYFAWVSPDDLESQVTYFDHETQEWGDIYDWGNPRPGATDIHAIPAIITTPEGHIMLFQEQLNSVASSSHNSPIHVRRSDNPEDLSSWSYIQESPIQSTLSYLFPVNFPSGRIALYARQVNSHMYCIVSDDDGITWRHLDGNLPGLSSSLVVEFPPLLYGKWAYNNVFPLYDGAGIVLYPRLGNNGNYPISYGLFTRDSVTYGNFAWYVGSGKNEFYKDVVTEGPIEEDELLEYCIIAGESENETNSYRNHTRKFSISDRMIFYTVQVESPQESTHVRFMVMDETGTVIHNNPVYDPYEDASIGILSTVVPINAKGGEFLLFISTGTGAVRAIKTIDFGKTWAEYASIQTGNSEAVSIQHLIDYTNGIVSLSWTDSGKVSLLTLEVDLKRFSIEDSGSINLDFGDNLIGHVEFGDDTLIERPSEYSTVLWTGINIPSNIEMGDIVGVRLSKFNDEYFSSVTTSFAPSGIRAMDYGKGVWVAVAEDGKVGYSSNTQEWFQVTPPFGNIEITNVCFADGKFLITGRSGNVGYSEDGVNWTSQNLDGIDKWGVAYGQGKWIVVGNDSNIWTSTDGISFQSETFPSVTIKRGVVFSNDMWVIVGNSGMLYTSTDGSSWVQKSSGSSDILWDASYNAFDKAWYVVGNGGRLLYSLDGGEQWSILSGISSLVSNNHLRRVKSYGNTTVIAGGGGYAIYSENNSDWARLAPKLGTSDIWGLGFDGVKWALGNNGGAVSVRRDGLLSSVEFYQYLG